MNGLNRIRKKRDQNTINDIVEKLEPVSNNNMVTKEEFLQKIFAKDVVKVKKTTVVGQMFI